MIEIALILFKTFMILGGIFLVKMLLTSMIEDLKRRGSGELEGPY